MWKYVIQDLAGTVKYMPYGILIGCLGYFILNLVRKKQGNTRVKSQSVAELVFWVYVAIMLVITFLSREGGSTAGIDLKIGSSLGINARNDAYVIENVLLFFPYGLLLGMLWKSRRGLWKCMCVGFFTSFGIECLQYISGRGVFQTDDLITNTVGAVLGYLVFWVFTWFCKEK